MLHGDSMRSSESKSPKKREHRKKRVNKVKADSMESPSVKKPENLETYVNEKEHTDQKPSRPYDDPEVNVSVKVAETTD